ncbi:nucleoside diphosphate kinase [mine drainage metagenome]|uniref:nucleoside-diphosphate kinase n=1 Tax=mine drainage metagenome TaxID=410659 RepID=A0A1J5T4I3_9ZZZZ
METTLIILKPDCLKKGVAGKVLDRFETAGLSVVGCKMAELSPEKLREHYAHLAEKPFYPEIEQFMRSRPVIIMALRGEGAVAKVRDLIGPTDYRKAAKGTVRGDFATSIMENIVHASDSVENAAAELKRFFNPGEVFAL